MAHDVHTIRKCVWVWVCIAKHQYSTHQQQQQ